MLVKIRKTAIKERWTLKKSLAGLSLLLAVGMGAFMLSWPRMSVHANLSEALVGQWEFDEGTGTTATDSSAEGNNGTLIQNGGSPAWISPGRDGSGSALQFNGAGARAAAGNTVNVGNDASLNGLSKYILSAWVKFDPGYVGNGGTWANIIGRTQGSNFSYMLYINANGRLRAHHVQSNGGVILYDSANVMPTGQWVHIAQIADGSRIRLIINGVEDATSAAYNGTSNSLPTANTYIGQDTREYTFLGSIDDVAIYDNFAAPGGVAGGLSAWQKADDGAAAGNIATWADSSGNGNDTTTGGTLTLQNNSMNFNPSVFMDNGYASYPNHLGVTGTSNFSTFMAAQLRSGHQNMLWGTWNASGQPQFYSNFATDGRVSTGVGHQSGTCNATTSSGVPLGQSRTISLIRSGGNTITGKQNGGLSSGAQTCTTSFSTGARLLGGRLNASNGIDRMRGNIAETISYNRTVTAAEENRINSYLGIKYGITLDQTTPQNYTASDGTTVSWNATTNLGYRYNITGIGRDDNSALNQKQSRSQNLEGIVTVGHNTIEATNIANTNDFSADKTFLTFGDDNNAATNWASTGATNTTLTNYQRLPRTWKVQETGSIGNVTVGLDTNDVDANVPAAISGYYLLRDSDNDSSFADETPILMTDTGSGQFSVSGVNFNNGELFTFATLANTYSVEIQVVDNLTGEDGDTGTFKVCLGARPSAAVTIALSSSNTDEGTVPASITIQPDDWNNCDANVVTVTGINDTPPAGDGAIPYTIVTGDVTSADTNFNALGGGDVDDVNMVNQNDDPPGIVASIADNTSGEDGSTARVRFALLSAPSANVTIPLSLSDGSEGSLGAVTSITITPANWNQPQNNEVVITGADDALTDGDILYQLVTGDPTSSDGGYGALVATDVADVTLTNTDNDNPGVTVTETAGSTNATEGGATDTFSVVLNSQPAPGNQVIITLQPNVQVNLGSGAGVAVQFTFTNGNWSVPQIATVTAHDDTEIEGDHNGIIALSIDPSSTESEYMALDPTDITANITDNDEDDDGVDQAVENACPNGGDANDDSIQDSTQRNVTCFVNPETGDYVAIEIDDACQINEVGVTGETAQTVQDADYKYPYGLMNFVADCGTPGYTTEVSMYFFDATGDLVLRKHNPNTNAYFTISGAAVQSFSHGGASGKVGTFQIEDGASLDADSTADGTITDPAGLALLASATSETGGGLVNTGQNTKLYTVVAVLLILTSLGAIFWRKLPGIAKSK